MTGWQADRQFPFTAALTGGAEVTHDVYVKGKGPPILIIQELPGIGPETLRLVDLLNAQGFTVYLPHFFGPFGRIATLRNALYILCVSREFHLLRGGQLSPVADYLRALCRHIRDTENVAGIGVIGMCLTGHFGLAMMADDAVLAGVASQPARLGMSEPEIAATCAAMRTKGPGLGLHYEGDLIASPKKMAKIKAAFGDGVEVTTYPGKGHSVLTLDFSQAGFDLVVDYFRGRLATNTVSRAP